MYFPPHLPRLDDEVRLIDVNNKTRISARSCIPIVQCWKCSNNALMTLTEVDGLSPAFHITAQLSMLE
ncbi:hypothetical protein HF325_003380 [Metschnikowia pulcherrima]|uniref:Uncharacterized protein n=1 Tax=Metschnikowia pulcherrima TaxID=27326 RepID=A0A8H7LCD9_9ASCO|nr:hypothetical protein HF325_003380 [Metschnikowia pulcherrima]